MRSMENPKKLKKKQMQTIRVKLVASAKYSLAIIAILSISSVFMCTVDSSDQYMGIILPPTTSGVSTLAAEQA